MPCVIDPVSASKASRLADVNLENVLLITPNDGELAALCRTSAVGGKTRIVHHLLERGVHNIWIRRGRGGSELFSRNGVVKISARDTEVIDTTGAGDAALAGWIYAWLRGKSSRECMLYGHILAEIILRTRGTWAENLNSKLLESTVLNRRPQ